MIAIENIDIVKVLLEKGADPNVTIVCSYYYIHHLILSL